MRKLITLRKIDRFEPIKNADRIETAVVGGWNVVVKKNEFTEGQSVLFFEIDSMLREDVPEFDFLMPRGVRELKTDNGIFRGHVLKTVRLRGVFSQGLIMDPKVFGISEDATQEEIDEFFTGKVIKWDPPLPMGSGAIGPFPGKIRKTDSERVQNLTQEFIDSLNPDDWFATEKIDGTSTTFWKDEDGKLHVAGRNWEISFSEAMKKLVEDFRIDEVLKPGDFISGEVFGEGVQANPLDIVGLRFLMFTGSREFDDVENFRVPVLDLPFPKTVEDFVNQVNGLKSTVNKNKQAEGIVWWNRNGEIFPETGNRPNFKAINNKYLLKHGG